MTGRTSIGTPTSLSYVAPLMVNATLGARYDKNRIVAYGEYGVIHGYNSTFISNDFGNHFMESMLGGYVGGGYRFGKFLPWYMIAYGDWKLGLPITNGRTVNHSLGLTYQASSSVMVKTQFDRFVAIGDLDGLNKMGTAHKISAGVDVFF